MNFYQKLIWRKILFKLQFLVKHRILQYHQSKVHAISIFLNRKSTSRVRFVDMEDIEINKTKGIIKRDISELLWPMKYSIYIFIIVHFCLKKYSFCVNTFSTNFVYLYSLVVKNTHFYWDFF